jgi:hypothetical protein
LARLDPSLIGTIDAYGLAARIPEDMRFGNLVDAYAAFTRRAQSATS